MNINVSCAYPGCTNPVIGQCVGYTNNCGWYYCSTHSSGRLCYDCARHKAECEEREKIDQLYYQSAKELYELQKKVDIYTLLFVLFFGGLSMLASFGIFYLVLIGYIDSDYRISGLILGCAFLIGGLFSVFIKIYCFARDRDNYQIMKRKYQTHLQGFSEFYKNWMDGAKEQQKSNTGSIVGGIAAVLFGIIALLIGAAIDSSEDPDTRKAVEKALDKRGYK